MALVLQDRVRESSATTGTGAITLGGAQLGYRAFASCVPDGSVVYYCIQNTTAGYEGEWEVGYGTYTLSGDTLSRDTVYSSSNGNALVPFSAGADLDVFITQPAEQAVYQETNGDLRLINGVIEVSLDGTSGTTLSNATFQAFGTVNGYIQNNIQNLSGGTDASSDFVATNDIGSDSDFYVDVGINSSGFNSASYPIYSPNSGYIYSTGNGVTTSDLFVGSGDGDVIIHAGGFNSNHVVATISGADQSVSFTNNVSANGTFTANGAATFGSTVTLDADPTTNLEAATKQYVDITASSGIQIHTPVRVESPTALTANYDNGVDGVGATLTNSGTQVALEIDGITLVLNDRVLVYQQSSALQNGIYYVSDVGSGSTNWELTRATDADSYATGTNTALARGSYVFVTSGDTGAGESYICTTNGTITFGSTAIQFTQFSATAAYTGTAPINVSGQVIALTGTVGATNGGTGANTVTTGDILYGSATNTWSKLAAGGQYRVLTMGASTPEWNAVALDQANAVSGTLGATNGGTGQNTYTLGDLIYSNATNTLAKLPGQTTTTKKYLQQQGDGVNSAAPSWQQVAAADISGLAPSATTDTSNASNITSGTLPVGQLSGSYTGITGVGTLAAGTWNANTIAVGYGGTGVATLTGLAYGNGTSAFSAATGSQVVAVIGSTAVANATYAVSSNSSTYSANIIGGAAGSIPYQTAANTTVLLASGSGVLVGGSTPSYSTAPTLTGTNFSGIPNSATTASASNGASTIVARDINGSFAANVVTATTFSGSGASLTTLNASNVTAGTLSQSYGGTGFSTYTLGDLIYANATNTLAKLPGQTTTSQKLLSQTGDGVNSAAPTWTNSLDGFTLANAAVQNTSTVTLKDTSFTLQDDVDPTKQAQFQLSNITTATTRTYTLPNLTGTLATTGTLVQTFSGTTTFSGTFTTSGATASFGTSTAAGTYTLGNGATISGATRTINIGTAGAAGSTTAITIGGTLNTTNVTANGDWAFSNTVTSAGDFVANSDEKLKTNWRPVQDDFVTKLANIKAGVYDRVDIDLTQAGVSAQSWQALLPETVQKGDNGILSVAYGNAALVAAVELAKEVVKLREELEALKAKTGA